MTDIFSLLLHRSARAAFWKRTRQRRDFRRRPVEERALLLATRQLENRHLGKRCFLLGAGPSISRQDLSKLQGEFVISVSNTFVHPLFRQIDPAYHVLPPLTSNHGQFYTEEKFVTWLREMENKVATSEMVMHIGDRGMVERNNLFRDKVIHWIEYAPWSGNFSLPVDLINIPKVWSVSETAITLAVYLGFEEIYLLGFDHDWFNGTFSYFYDHTKQHALRPDQINTDFVDAEFQMRRHAEIFRKYKYLYSIRRNIFNANANKNHYMDVFPKVDFDEVCANRESQSASK